MFWIDVVATLFLVKLTLRLSFFLSKMSDLLVASHCQFSTQKNIVSSSICVLKFSNHNDAFSDQTHSHCSLT